MTAPENLRFLPARDDEPSAERLLFALAGVAQALDLLTIQGEDDRNLIGNLATAADSLARLLVHRLGSCPVEVAP
jgi:hypothetical protein